MGTPPPAGWFTSPDDDTAQRWWDGTAWTTSTRPVPAVEPSTPTVPPAEVPAQRVAPAFPSDPAIDARVRDASSGRYRNSSEALEALQHQGGLVGVFATLANQTLAGEQPAPVADANGLQPYGRSGQPAPYGTEGSGAGGTNVSWQLGPFSGGTSSSDGRRPVRRNAGPLSMLIIGVVFLLVGFPAARAITDENTTHAGESSITGSVVDRRTTTTTRGSVLCSPIASFTVGGESYRASSNVSTDHCARVGSEVMVIYTTTDPGDGRARIKSAGPLAWVPWLFPVAGLAFTLLALRTIGRAGWRRARSRAA